jgi:hypothetical protein
VLHPPEKSRFFVSKSPTVGRRERQTDKHALAALSASGSCRVLRADPGACRYLIDRQLLWGQGALGGRLGDRDTRLGRTCSPSLPPTSRLGTGTSLALGRAGNAQLPPWRETGTCRAQRRVGSFAQSQAAIRQPQKPGREASHLLLLSQLGRDFLFPSPGPRLHDPDRRGEGGGSGRRFPALAAPGVAGVAPSPPRRCSRGRPRSQARCDWLAAARGAEPQGPVSHAPPQKSPGYRRVHWSPGQPAALPGAGKAGSWGFSFASAHSLLQTIGSYMLLCPPLPLHVPMLLCQQQVRAAECFFPSFSLAVCVSWGMDSGHRPLPYPAPLFQRCPAVILLEAIPHASESQLMPIEFVCSPEHLQS